MNRPDRLSIGASKLVVARKLSHLACQLPSKAARANLASESDDSHSNLGWSKKHYAFVTHPMGVEQRIQTGFSFSTRALIWLVDDSIEHELALENESAQSTERWMDARLEQTGLNPLSHAEMPYELASLIDYSHFKNMQFETSVLGAWYDYGQQALDYVIEINRIGISAPTLRCWPHHFDLGALLVIETGDSETARSIGVGFSPGDDSYAEPYFYFTPWPVPITADLPAPDEPLRWHTEGFVSVVVRASDLDKDIDVEHLLSYALLFVKNVVGD